MLIIEIFIFNPLLSQLDYSNISSLQPGILLSKKSFSLHWKDLFRSWLMLFFYQDWSLVDYKICSCALQTAIDKLTCGPFVPK